MSSDDSTRSGNDSKFKAPGPGLPFNWLCMGCNKPRSMVGRRGVGVRKRCAVCVAGKKQ